MQSVRLLRSVASRGLSLYKRTRKIGRRIRDAGQSVEEPSFSTEVRDQPFEIRRYGARVIAETTVTGEWTVAGNQGFHRLAGYIFGKNQRSTKIAMTAPVVQAPPANRETNRDGRDDEKGGARISMTAPVVQRAGGDRAWTIGFTMPEGETLATLPVPDDERVVLRAVPPTRVAVVRFTGRWTTANMKQHEARLRAWLRARQLAPAGEPEVNRYDPPFKPWFLRRNEVWIPIADEPAPRA